MGAITANQLGIVLKSIEEKYAALKDENARLVDRLEEHRLEKVQLLDTINRQQGELERLELALEQVPAPTLSEEPEDETCV